MVKDYKPKRTKSLEFRSQKRKRELGMRIAPKNAKWAPNQIKEKLKNAVKRE
uniref:Uncharacterized protein n=1 Tax=Rhizophora mucronata TaxID=61149 RepID=A0A2P2NEL9_RHIMU